MLRLSLVIMSSLLVAEVRADATRPLFTRPDGLSDAGKVVLDWVRDARFHGLDHTPEFVLPVVETWLKAPSAPADLVEQTLDAQLARLVAELAPRPRTVPVLDDPETRFYPTPDVLWRNVAPPTASAEALSAAHQAVADGTLHTHLASLLPTHPQYGRLVDAAKRYNSMCQAGGFPAVARPVIKRPKPGRTKFTTPKDDYALALRARLAAEGFLPTPDPTAPSNSWDDAARDAFSRWLTSRQLPQPGGLLMDDLHTALAITCDELVATLTLNAKRWRHSGWRGEPTFVEVNIAAQELRYVRDSTLVMTQRTIVGSNKWYFDTDLGRRLNLHATPVLSDQITRIIVNPIWAVPPRIAQNVIDKEVAKDPTYLERKRIQLVTSARGRTYIQSPGAENALGAIKILFPNDEDVYLHDTPKKGPFKLAVRALSHGCVRVQNALDFGLQLLIDDAAKAGRDFDAESLRKRAGRGGSIIFDLTTEVPVFLEYYTASVDDSGLVRFHPDIYAYDADPAAPRR